MTYNCYTLTQRYMCVHVCVFVNFWSCVPSLACAYVQVGSV